MRALAQYQARVCIADRPKPVSCYTRAQTLDASARKTQQEGTCHVTHPAYHPVHNSASTPLKCVSKFISQTACRLLPWSDCRKQRYARPAIGFAPQYSIQVSNFQRDALPSTSHPLIYPRRVAASIYQSRWLSSPPQGKSRKTGLAGFACFGELALSGACCRIDDLLPSLVACQQAGQAVIIPQQNKPEASLLRDLPIRLADSLAEICSSLNGGDALPTPIPAHSIQPNFRGSGSGRRIWPATSQTSTRNRRRWRPSHADDGATRHRQKHAGTAPDFNTAADERGGGNRMRQSALDLPAARYLRQNWLQRPFQSPHHTVSGMLRWSVVDATRGRGKFHWPTMECCFWMNLPNSTGVPSRSCVNPSKAGASTFPEPPGMPNFRHVSSSSRQ